MLFNKFQSKSTVTILNIIYWTRVTNLYLSTAIFYVFFPFCYLPIIFWVLHLYIKIFWHNIWKIFRISLLFFIPLFMSWVNINITGDWKKIKNSTITCVKPKEQDMFGKEYMLWLVSLLISLFFDYYIVVNKSNLLEISESAINITHRKNCVLLNSVQELLK